MDIFGEFFLLVNTSHLLPYNKFMNTILRLLPLVILVVSINATAQNNNDESTKIPLPPMPVMAALKTLPIPITKPNERRYDTAPYRKIKLLGEQEYAYYGAAPADPRGKPSEREIRCTYAYGGNDIILHRRLMETARKQGKRDRKSVV